ncbi:SH3 domain-containing protein [Pelagovum pacificum]|uniref:SH3b domain-containing protein n=1 Tax=Pelagovum pacificum TaxID=2588711 RepID=A0A5C5G9F8_9RHOB|nr:SH3 domain-containing protein [Pelagovum pacificum]QQA42291.1 SH3 domain-containing protein [Pelagovum pacificum]TNY31375.1 hypothetical protein FHY64_15265 [Pelagovum pacificum]
MKRFILLTFGFLAWGYWEMSGGSDFVPETRMAATLSTSTPTAASSDEDIPEFVTRARVSPVDDISGPSTADAGDDVVLASAPADAGVETMAEDDGPKWVSAADAIEDAIVLANSATEAPPRVEEAEMRTVSVAGSRVNMRMGPGTDYSVVTTLNQGTEAEVIESRNGWARLQVLDSGQTGWMAERLLDGI